MSTSIGAPTSWMPEGWSHPTVVPVGAGHHLRPVTARDVDLGMRAVLSSRERLWSIYGRAWSWPSELLTRAQELENLRRHESENLAHESFTYALFDTAETAILGYVYVDPPERVGADAEVSWWVVDEVLGTELAGVLDTLVPVWIHAAWPLRNPRLIGRDLTWDAWLELPEPPL